MASINFEQWSLKKKIAAGIILGAFAILILSLLLFRSNKATRIILDLPEGSIKILNMDGEKISLDIRAGSSDSTFAGVNPQVIKKTVLYSATPYPASAAKTIKDVSVSIDIAFFAEEGKLIKIYDVAANSEKNFIPEKQYQYTIMTYNGFFEEKGISVKNGSKLLPDILSNILPAVD